MKRPTAGSAPFANDSITQRRRRIPRRGRAVAARRPTGLPTVLLTVLLATVLAVLAGCEPRRHVPRDLNVLLPAEQEEVAYRWLELPNRLQVMLVSDPNVDKAAAAMSVAAGSLSNPDNRPGLAHFLEHMLFLGTEKYPDPAEYNKYLSRHAGGGNAYTADDHTNYFFEVAPDALDGALDRFAQFFIAPLFNPEYAEREMKAVASEHAKNVESDHWRVRQVERMHFREEHPVSRFATGDTETLQGVGREQLRQFYREHYSANLMRLVVVGSAGLDELEAMVRGRFEQVPDRDLERPAYPTEYLPEQRALRVVRVKPVADQRMLQVHFPLPPVEQHYKAKPLRLIGFVLGHEGEGSLLSQLKRDNLAHSLSAGRGMSTRDYASVELSIGLTPEGRERWREVLSRVLGTIDKLRREGIPRYLFEENRVMSELDWRYRGQQEASSQARSLAALMLSYPPGELPRAAYVIERYAPELYQRLLGELTPENMLVTLVARDVETEEVEPYYGAEYSYAERSGEPWQRMAAATPPAGWHLPAPNRFIPERVVLREPRGPLKLAGVSYHHLREDGAPEALLERLEPLRGETFTGGRAFLSRMEGVLTAEQRARWLPLLLKDSLALPVRLLDVPQAKVWYLPDWRLRQPKAHIVLEFHVRDAYASPRQVMLRRLYTAALEESLNEFGYPVREAGLSYAIESTTAGVRLTLDGYSARMLELLQFLVERLERVEIDPGTFASLKERAVRGLENEKLSQPYRQARYYGRLLLVEPNFTHEALRAALEPLTLADVRRYAAGLLERTYVKGVVVGNLGADDARGALRTALETLDAGVLPAAQRVEEQVRRLPEGAQWVFSQRLPVDNSAAYLYHQAGRSEPRLRGALLLIGKPLQQSFYFNMRTQQQLGYIVWAGMGQIEQTLSLVFLIQSGEHAAGTLLERMTAFRPQFIEEFRAMPAEEFENYRRSVIKAKLDRPSSLGGVADRLYYVAFEYDEKFDHVSEDIAAVEALTREEVEGVLARTLADDARRLAVRLIGREHEAGEPQGEVVQLPERVQPQPAAAVGG